MANQLTVSMAKSSHLGIKPRAGQRMTHEKLVSLRAATRRKHGVIESVSASVGATIKNVVSLIAIGSMEKNISTCRYYGHSFDRSSWTGHLPKCTNCGANIHSLDEIRKSTPQR